MTTENQTPSAEGTEAPRRRSRPPIIPVAITPVVSPMAQQASNAPQPEPANPPVMPTTLEESSLTRAARRAAELRDHAGSMDQGTDDFFIDPTIIPDGWSYEWKRYTILGAQDPSYQVALAQAGWEAVPARRHPALMPTNWDGACIERRGMILMERPKEITDIANNRELNKARTQVRQKEVQLNGAPPGTFERSNKDQSMVKVKHSYEPMAIPEK